MGVTSPTVIVAWPYTWIMFVEICMAGTAKVIPVLWVKITNMDTIHLLSKQIFIWRAMRFMAVKATEDIIGAISIGRFFISVITADLISASMLIVTPIDLF